MPRPTPLKLLVPDAYCLNGKCEAGIPVRTWNIESKLLTFKLNDNFFFVSITDTLLTYFVVYMESAP